MAQLNKTQKGGMSTAVTHEGGKAYVGNATDQLRRTVMCCLLWEDNFYEDGEAVADRVKRLVPLVEPEVVHQIAVEARHSSGLRHVPLLLAREMVRHPEHKKVVANTLASVVSRPDELTEFVNLYWATNDKTTGKHMLPRQVKRGLGWAMRKFSPYQLAKWDKADKPVRLRDVLFLVHAKPLHAPGQWTKEQRRMAKQYESIDQAAATIRGKGLNEAEALYANVAAQNLLTPNTWEVRLSGGEDKRAVFEDLMLKRALGGLAFIRNLRKMTEVGVSESAIREYSTTVNINGIMPWQLMMAARVVPQFEREIDAMLARSLADMPKLPGKTIVVCDVSGSMKYALSKRTQGKGVLTYSYEAQARPEENCRADAACGVAILVAASAARFRTYAFSTKVKEVPPRQGLALRDAIMSSMPHGGTHLASSVREVLADNVHYDRIIVITDEQSQDGTAPGLPAGKLGYMVNVGTYERKVTNGRDGWHSITGWSPGVLAYIRAHEGLDKPVVGEAEEEV